MWLQSSGSPLLPAEVIVAPEDQEEAQNGREDDRVSRENQCARAPLNLRQEEGHGQRRGATRRSARQTIPIISNVAWDGLTVRHSTPSMRLYLPLID